MTEQEVAAYRERQKRLQERIDALPMVARGFLERWAGGAAFQGRAWRGQPVEYLEEFVAGVEWLFASGAHRCAPEPKAAGPVETGKGF